MEAIDAVDDVDAAGRSAHDRCAAKNQPEWPTPVIATAWLQNAESNSASGNDGDAPPGLRVVRKNISDEGDRGYEASLGAASHDDDASVGRAVDYSNWPALGTERDDAATTNSFAGASAGVAAVVGVSAGMPPTTSGTPDLSNNTNDILTHDDTTKTTHTRSTTSSPAASSSSSPSPTCSDDVALQLSHPSLFTPWSSPSKTLPNPNNANTTTTPLQPLLPASPAEAFTTPTGRLRSKLMKKMLDDGTERGRTTSGNSEGSAGGGSTESSEEEGSFVSARTSPNPHFVGLSSSEAERELPLRLQEHQLHQASQLHQQPQLTALRRNASDVDVASYGASGVVFNYTPPTTPASSSTFLRQYFATAPFKEPGLEGDVKPRVPISPVSPGNDVADQRDERYGYVMHGADDELEDVRKRLGSFGVGDAGMHTPIHGQQTKQSQALPTHFQAQHLQHIPHLPTGLEDDAIAPNAQLENDIYAPCLPPLPEPSPHRRVDQNRLREMRKRLETPGVGPKEVEAMLGEVMGEAIELCTDYIGNVVIQKLLERSPDTHRLLLLHQVSSHMSTIGVHKNGTWAIQKMIDLARTPPEMELIANALLPYTPPLLLDPFGNYVVQCCLRFGFPRNQFIFDAMEAKVVEVGTGRFGARAMRACLESGFSTATQRGSMGARITDEGVRLMVNPNGTILVNWVMESGMQGVFGGLARGMSGVVHALCCHKLGGGGVVKLVTQRTDPAARDTILHALFFRDDVSLAEVLMDHVHGVSVIHKILATGCISLDEKIRIADRIRVVLVRVPQVLQLAAVGGKEGSGGGLRKVLDELAGIPSGLNLYGGAPGAGGNLERKGSLGGGTLIQQQQAQMESMMLGYSSSRVEGSAALNAALGGGSGSLGAGNGALGAGSLGTSDGTLLGASRQQSWSGNVATAIENFASVNNATYRLGSGSLPRTHQQQQAQSQQQGFSMSSPSSVPGAFSGSGAYLAGAAMAGLGPGEGQGQGRRFSAASGGGASGPGMMLPLGGGGSMIGHGSRWKEDGGCDLDGSLQHFQHQQYLDFGNRLDHYPMAIGSTQGLHQRSYSAGWDPSCLAASDFTAMHASQGFGQGGLSASPVPDGVDLDDENAYHHGMQYGGGRFPYGYPSLPNEGRRMRALSERVDYRAVGSPLLGNQGILRDDREGSGATVTRSGSTSSLGGSQAFSGYGNNRAVGRGF
ncbi:hypothetical protein HDU97_004788 [Phlyctochytrium planicorne]|nr:hypothetical protein HDU97_004788 [Phlyctochytrium planicorne]